MADDPNTDKASKPTRELALLVHPDDVKEQAGQDALVESVADGIVEAVQAERKRQGLPALTD